MMGFGILALSFYAVHGAVQVVGGHPENLLWACHLASVAIGAGLICRSPAANALGTEWLCLGLPIWLLNLATGGEFEPTSVLTHVGGIAVGLVGVRRLGVPRGTWWKAVAALVGLGLVCGWVTPPGENVNLSHAVWKGWEKQFPSYTLYRVYLSAIAGGTFWVAEWGLRWIGRGAGVGAGVGVRAGSATVPGLVARL